MSRKANNTKPKLVILNQYFVPDVASTGHLLHELAAELASQGWDVRVITSQPSYGPRESWQDAPRKEVLDGVHVHRMWTTRFSKDNLLGRACNYFSFFGQLAFRMLLTSKPDVVYLYTTNPPFLGAIGGFVSLFRRHRYVTLLHDAYPQLAVWVGTISDGGLVEKLWHMLNRQAYKRAEQNIVLCQAARRLVSETYRIDADRIHVIPNWADETKLFYIPKEETNFAKEHGLVEPFTVLYSGNLGLYYEFETILDVAEKMLDKNFQLVFIGSGGRKSWIEEQVRQRNLTNVKLLPYQPFETLNDSLNACDVSLVTIARGIEGISFPSKLYSSLAVGKPILALSEPNSELRDIVRTYNLGTWAELGDSDALVGAISELMKNKEKLTTQGKNCRKRFLERYTRKVAAKSYSDVLALVEKERGVEPVLHDPVSEQTHADNAQTSPKQTREEVA